MLQAMSPDTRCLVALLKAGSDVNMTDNDPEGEGGTALNYAACFNCIENVRILIKAGADVNRRNKAGRGALWFALFNHCNRIAEILIRAGARVNEQDWTGRSLLMIATEALNVPGAELLLASGADVNLENSMKEKFISGFDTTPLMAASSNSCVELVTMFLDNGACVRKRDMYGRSSLKAAVHRKHYQIVSMLVAAGADVNQGDNNNDTPLASAMSSYGIAKILVDNGADVNGVSTNGCTPLMEAARINRMECVELLLRAGANVNAMSRYGDTALMFAAGGGHHQCTQMLLEAGSDPELRNLEGHSALDQAVRADPHKAVVVLLEAKPSLFPVDTEEHSPLGYPLQTALSYYDAHCVRVLLKHVTLLPSDPEWSEYEYAPRDFQVLVHAAGWVVPGFPPAPRGEPDCLKHSCREAVRRRLREVNPRNASFFDLIPRLGLPTLITTYLLYGETLRIGYRPLSSEETV